MQQYVYNESNCIKIKGKERKKRVEKRIIQVEEKVPAKLLVPLSIQHMFAMFGASVLVPFMFGINPAIVLLMNGVGSLFLLRKERHRLTLAQVSRFCHLESWL